MKNIIYLLIIIYSNLTVCFSQNNNTGNVLLENLINSKSEMISSYLADSIIIEDVPLKTSKKIGKKVFISKYWPKIQKTYKHSDFIVKKTDNDATVWEIFNHCNSHKINLTENQIIDQVKIVFIFIRDSKTGIKGCRG